MLRIEEIVGAMDDEFRYALATLDDERLNVLLDDNAGLRRLRPVGVSNREAQAMIRTILAARRQSADYIAKRNLRAFVVGAVRSRRGILPPPARPLLSRLLALPRPFAALPAPAKAAGLLTHQPTLPPAAIRSVTIPHSVADLPLPLPPRAVDIAPPPRAVDLPLPPQAVDIAPPQGEPQKAGISRVRIAVAVTVLAAAVAGMVATVIALL